MNDDYDTPWKDALRQYFPEFLSFYFPQAFRVIDWSVPHVFLEQELAQITRDSELSSKRVDKLVRVVRKDGAEKWVLVHVELQGYVDQGFAERIYVYNYRIYDRYRAPVASLAVLADSNCNWKPRKFTYRLFGCRVALHFPIVKLSDYAPSLQQLLGGTNPFGLVTAAHLLTQQTRGRDVERYAAKWYLTRLLHRRDWDKQRICELFNVIDWMMQIPPALQSQLMTNIEAFERSRAMQPYLSSFERRGLERGLERGRQEALSALLSRQLARRFGSLPERVKQRLQTATAAELEGWGEAVIDAPTLESVFAQR
ncbi:DUF4351 domain-containing protein [Massilia horti]|uniref:DUF4351 domain-containing protein n=1 Tax=Massilia horti TaxID=2562153 RepID=A0A4Y9SQH1_9BURK|nr:DUF4351 domain-containing protein [Massilia horti]TFW27599.1 DUF4351 domain-containing protein [Massilia horti]